MKEKGKKRRQVLPVATNCAVLPARIAITMEPSQRVVEIVEKSQKPELIKVEP